MFIYPNTCMPSVLVATDAAPGRPATWDDYYKFSRTQQAEYIDGQILPSPIATEKHNRVRLRVAQLLDRLVDVDLRVNIAWAWRDGCDVFIPDVMVYEAEDNAGDWYTGVPSVLVEVVDAQASVDWVIKAAKYAESGVPQYWVVDPYQETVDVLHLSGNHYLPSGIFDSRYRGALRVDAVEADGLISCIFDRKPKGTA